MHRGKPQLPLSWCQGLCEQRHPFQGTEPDETFLPVFSVPYCFELLWASRAVEQLSLALATWVQVPSPCQGPRGPLCSCLQGQCRQWRLQDITSPLKIIES